MKTKNNKVIVMTGVSGVGKTTLSKALGEDNLIVSYTTRAPRKGEIDGVDYYFIKKEQAEEILNSNNSFENVEFDGNHYGVTIDEVEDKTTNNFSVLVANADFYKDVEYIDGKLLYKKQFEIEPVIITVDYETITNQLIGRGGNYQSRLLNIQKEFETVINLRDILSNYNLKDLVFTVEANLSVEENQERFVDFIKSKGYIPSN